VRRALIILGHGSRNALATQQFQELISQLRLHSQVPVYEAFMELSEPNLDTAFAAAVAAGADELVVQPCFLFAGNHIESDIPTRLVDLATKYPHVSVRYGRPLGPDARLIDILLERAQEATWLS